MLRMAVPGNPGEDYPIYAEVPETSFTCEGRVEGGYYADTEAECQPFHVCSADRDGGLVRNSFLCPNGTLFNQENFVCEYWFNVDCSQAESFYGLNDNIGVEQANGLDDAASSSSGQYASPPSEAASSPSGGYASPPSGAASSPSGGYASPPSGAASSPTGGYASPSSDGPLAGYTSLRTGRREGRVLSGARKNSVQSSFQGTKLRNSNSRFQNFPATVRKGKGNTRIVESKKQTRKDVGNTRDTNAGRRQKELSSDAKILTITSKNFFQRGGNQKNQNKLNKSIKSPSTLRSINLKLKKKERKRRPFNKVSQIENSQRVEPQLNRSGKSFSKRKQSKNKIGRSGRQEVSTGYLPPIDNSYSAGDATLAASSPDYDYEEAPLPTYAGASDSAGQSSYIAPAADTGYAAGSADTAYEAPAHSGGDVDALADAVYEEEPLPTYNRASSGSSSGYKAPVPDSVYESGSDFQEDILPAYNNGIYNNADSEGTSYTAPSGDSYGAPSDDSYGAPSDDSYAAPSGDSYEAPAVSADDGYGSPASSDYEDDVLPQYNNGVYNPGSESSDTSGTSYTAPSSESYAAPSALANSDYEQDILPQYNNGVYNNGGTSYTAPSSDSYGAAREVSATGNTAPAAGYTVPIPGSYQDPQADILPEYFKSEITLGLNEVDDVPRVDPFLSDYGSAGGDSYRVAGSSPVAAVVKTPDLTYGVPAAPTISLEDYNIQEVSDKGFGGVGGSSYGR